MTHQLTISLGDRDDLAWAQRTVTEQVEVASMGELRYNWCTSIRKKCSGGAGNTPLHGSRKVKFLMQANSTRVPYFPPNLDDYAPWVSEFGLTAPYGECQCGCGALAAMARDNVPERGYRKGYPVRFVRGHRILEEKRDVSQATPEGYTDGICKTCTVCGESKPATTEYFSPSALGRYGLRSNCKECAKVSARAVRFSHPGLQAQRTRKWRASHKEKQAIYMRSYKKANRELIKEIAQRRRAREYGAQGTHTKADIERQYQAQKGKCYYCSAKVGKRYHVDHVIPLSRGGSDGPENLVIACAKCNQAKNNKMPHEWIEGGRLL